MVSIAMATYNGERFLREQIDSLYSQTVKPSEIIVVDDNSIDGTIEILEEYKKKYGLKYYRNKSNLGVNKTFEKALKLTTGDYVMFCDQDDIWFPNKIEVTLNKMKEIGGDLPAVVSSQCDDIDAQGNIIRKYKKNKENNSHIETTFIDLGNCQGSTMMLNRKLINLLKPFPEQMVMYDRYISCLAAAIGIKYNLYEPLMYYRHHDRNVTTRITNYSNKNFKKRLNNLKKESSSIIPKDRLMSLLYINKEYSELIKDEASKLIKELNAYSNKGLISKLIYLLKLKNINYRYKQRVAISDIISKLNIKNSNV